MSNECDGFRFKQFTIAHDKAAMRVGTDGVLLGAWCDTAGARRVLDIGAGSGLIAIMLAQRTAAQIVGVEIDAVAAAQAADNARKSPWPERIKIVCGDIGEYAPPAKFDLIVSNPPYFAGRSAVSASGRDIARTTLALTHAQLLSAVSKLLSPDGSFAVVLPSAVADTFIYMAWESNLRLAHRTEVVTAPHKPPKRTLLQFANEYVAETVADVLLLNDDNGHRSPQYRALTGDFYL